MKQLWTALQNKILLLFVFAAAFNYASAQTNETTYSGPEMATGFYAAGKIYVVIGVIAIVLVGIFLYLIRLDRKINKIEKEIN
ncbi:MAG: CcmD family protein [Fimbriimonadaceae bacterium]|nr:CcmD family protein [Chitinophagales bacterium]